MRPNLPLWRKLSATKGSPRIHVLGLGSIGTFMAHALAEGPKALSVSLLLHRESLMEGYISRGRRILLETRGQQPIARTGYNLEVLHNAKWYHIDQSPNFLEFPANEIIEDLIVCVKTIHTVAALRPLISRLNSRSKIMFLQNGAGMIEDVNEHIFNGFASRPSYITGVISHGVKLERPCHITHTGIGTTSIGSVPRDNTPAERDERVRSPFSSSPMLRALPLVRQLNCKTYGWPEILQVQLEKLATNATCNALCALADASTDYVFSIPDICHALIAEISSVALALPELQGVTGVAERFSFDALVSTVMSILDRNRETTCSMVWDLRAGRETEVRYINGYWGRRGREIGVTTPINDELVAKIESRTAEENIKR